MIPTFFFFVFAVLGNHRKNAKTDVPMEYNWQFLIMKKIGLLIVLFCVSLMTMAQDVIVKNDGTTILSKVLEISSTEIKYKKWSNQDGPMYSIDRSEVHTINYQNGETEVITKASDATKSSLPKRERMSRKGKYLTVNGHILSAEDVLTLVGEENYETYLSAFRQSQRGGSFLVSTGLMTVMTTLFFVGAATSRRESSTAGLAIAGYIVGAYVPIGLTLGCVFKGVGNGRISHVADEYNRGGRSFSYQVSPSVIRYNSVEKQVNAFGVTLSVKF